MATEPIILVCSSDSSIKTYSVFRRGNELANVDIVHTSGESRFHIRHKETVFDTQFAGGDRYECLSQVLAILIEQGVIDSAQDIAGVGIQISAPGGYFLQDRHINDYEITILEQLKIASPTQLEEQLKEIYSIKQLLPRAKIIGVSDSAFHVTKPDYAWNYAISLEDADTYDIKRFGYNGIALESVRMQLKGSQYATLNKVVVCYLGNQSSATALFNRKSIDTTMGFSNSEGMMMATQAGSLSYTTGLALAKKKNVSPNQLGHELSNNAGLYGISGSSSDILALIEKESAGDHRAELAVSMYVYSARQAIAQMVASLQGIDGLVFAGPTAMQSAHIRKRIVDGLEYLGLVITPKLNLEIISDKTITVLQPRTRSKPVLVVPIQKERIMQSHVRSFLV